MPIGAMTPFPEPIESPDEGEDHDPEFLAAFQQVAARLRDGGAVDDAAIEREYPQFASELIEALPGLTAVAALAAQRRGALPDDLAGTELGGYKIVRAIGHGGMGSVYEAWQPSLRRRVALKVLPPVFALDPRAIKRFEREAEAIASLDHEHIVPIYTVDVSGARPFFAMKHIRGHSLAELIRALRGERSGAEARDEAGGRRNEESLSRLSQSLLDDAFSQDRQHTETGASPRVFRGPAASGPEPTVDGSKGSSHKSGLATAVSCERRSYVNAVARIGLQAALALQHAHDSGVIHRDIKPGNFLLDMKGHLWLTDFGLAWLRGRDATNPSAPAGGTFAYMSPEQLAPEPRPVDHRTDIYSLGVTLYELLTLRRPFDVGEDQPGRALARILTEDPVNPRRFNRAIPRDLVTIVGRAMEKDATDRFETAADVAHELRLFLAGRPLTIRPASIWERAGRWLRDHRKAVAGWVATFIVVLAATTAVLFTQYRRANAMRTASRGRSRGCRGMWKN